MSLPQGVLLRLETLLYQPERGEEGDAERGLVEMHVQSVSGWAPANIGPYSQAVRVSGSLVLSVVWCGFGIYETSEICAQKCLMLYQ